MPGTSPCSAYSSCCAGTRWTGHMTTEFCQLCSVLCSWLRSQWYLEGQSQEHLAGDIKWSLLLVGILMLSNLSAVPTAMRRQAQSTATGKSLQCTALDVATQNELLEPISFSTFYVSALSCWSVSWVHVNLPCGWSHLLWKLSLFPEAIFFESEFYNLQILHWCQGSSAPSATIKVAICRWLTQPVGRALNSSNIC